MAEYIDREALLQEISQQKAASKHSFPRRSFVVGDALTCIRTAPSADVAPVVNAKWISRMFGTHECSNCHNDPSHFDGATGYIEILSDYCPHCGAKMERGEHEND